MRPLHELSSLTDDWEAMSAAYLPGRDQLLDAAIAAIGAHCRPAARILDLGGGPGTVARRIVDRLPTATVLVADADPALIHLGSTASPPGVGFLLTDLTTADWPTLGSFDAVVCVLSLHYFDATTKSAVMAGAHRVLAGGGPLISIDMFGTPRRASDPEPWSRWWRRAGDSTDPGLQEALTQRRVIASAEHHTTIRRHLVDAAASGFDGHARVLARHGRAAAVWTTASATPPDYDRPDADNA
ncbi:MAG: class I SAM-dependent methyltransferase [Acidimicrobiia bacterium]